MLGPYFDRAFPPDRMPGCRAATCGGFVYTLDVPKAQPRSGSKKTQTERAYEALKNAVLRGEIPEGVFLSEAEIMKRFGIGRTPFREACNRLHYEGLLEVVARRGYLVPEMSFHAVRELCEARLLLEGVIAELAAQRATAEEIDALDKMARRPPSDGPNAFEILIDANREFHLCLAKMTRNRELTRILSRLLERTQHLMYIELRYGGFDSTSFAMLHQPISSAIRRRDPAAVREAVLQDIRQAQGATFGKLSFDGESPNEKH